MPALAGGVTLGYEASMTENRTDIEEHLSHLSAMLDDMSAIVRRQQDRIDILERRVAVLMQREAERQADGDGAHVFGDERPPHW